MVKVLNLKLIRTFVVLGLLVCTVTGQSVADDKLNHTLLDFEGKDPIAGNNTSHKAKVSVVDDVPEGGGRVAVKTVADANAGAAQFFGTGFRFPVSDLSSAGAISLWIKTDIESGFNLQIHSGKNGNSGVSVFPFSTIGSKGEWKKITAPIARFSQPPWSSSKADLSKISKIQVTAFGSGPYDGKSITQAQSDQYKVGTHIEAFIDTQQLQNVGIFYHESHQCQFTK